MSEIAVEPRRILVFDTTLRDGEQSPGVALTVESKLAIARSLERLGVDIIEAGFPAASRGDLDSVQRVARELRVATVCALARTHTGDIEAAARALDGAANGRIHTFIATSRIHMERKLHLTPDEVLERAVQAVRLARGFVDDVEFSAEDAGRSDPEFLSRIFTAVIEAGATTINIPDTVGYTQPAEFGGLIRALYATTPALAGVIVSVHCHDDLGLAVANTLAGVEAGATQVEGCINGIGERAGNAALEEVIMALHTRPGYYNAMTSINTRELYRASRLVSRLTGMAVQANKAIVGDNAFAHEAGIHQDGVLKARETYEIMNAEMVGREAAVLVLGKHSGRAAFRKALTDLGYALDDTAVNTVFSRFKDLADRKGAVNAEEIRALVDTDGTAPTGFALDKLQVVSGTHLTAMATVTLSGPNGPSTDSGTGDGPVDAALNAVSRASGIDAILESYRIAALSSGRDAAAEVSVRVRVGDRSYPGTGIATDVVEASTRAWLNAVNASGQVGATPREPADVLGAV